jgi:NAD(P)-dependent dehydrogenase (short-subunit alcohol dehydrogenase family)
MKISDSAFLVTGASSGLGAATARLLVQRGAAVSLADVSDDAGFQLAESLGSRARFVHVDVTSPSDVQNALDDLARHLGPPRGVVHCAGILGAGRIVGRDGPLPLEEFARVVQVNLVGTFNVLRLAAAAMSEAPPLDDDERGVFIATASVAAFEGQIGQAAYSASKGGVAGLTLPAARELARFGVRVVSIAPGLLETPMMAGMSPQVRESLVAQTIFPQRLGRPEEFAQMAAAVIENRLVNGAVLRLDGAVRLAAK